MKARRIKDCDNLREIWKSIEMYKNDCGIFPFALGQLLDAGYIKDSRVLICPTQKTEPPLDSNDIRKGQCGYLYWGNNISDMNPETIIACTKPGLLSMPAIFKKGFLNVPWNLRTIGGDNYVNVLYLDGHASGFLKPPDDLEIITEKINPLKSHSTYSP